MRSASKDAGHMPGEGHGGISISVSSNGAGVRSDRMSPLLPEDEATLVLDRATYVDSIPPPLPYMTRF